MSVAPLRTARDKDAGITTAERVRFVPTPARIARRRLMIL